MAATADKSARGVVYFATGLSHLERLLVSAFSLRRHWSGPCAVLHDGPVAPEFAAALAVLDIAVIELPGLSRAPLVAKVESLPHSPFEVSLFLDADTLVEVPVDPLFERLGGHDFLFVHFCGWEAGEDPVARRIQAWADAGLSAQSSADRAKRGPGVNIGVFAYRHRHPFLGPWAEQTAAGQRAGLFIPDETGLQLRLPELDHVIAEPPWCVSPVHSEPEAPRRIIHYHGAQHDKGWPLCAVWRREREAVTRFFSARNEVAVRPGVTIVTAIDPGYLPVLEANWPTWNFPPQTPVRLITHALDEREVAPFLERGDVSIHPWDLDGVGQRERMLTSFVTLAPHLVETPWWIKLDADCFAGPGASLFDEDRFYEVDLSAHEWYWTSPGSWVRTLEEWGDEALGGRRVFTEEELAEADGPRTFTSRRVPRFQSIACLHKTEFSRHVAELVGPGGRLPVPSHDTFLWYVLARTGRRFLTTDVHAAGWGHGHYLAPDRDPDFAEAPSSNDSVKSDVR